MLENQVKTHLELAKKTIDDNYHNPNKNAQSSDYFLNLYSFTNENLSACLKDYNFTNNHVLTLGSSADQVLNFISKGSTDVTLLDLNPFVKYYYDLKTAAIFTLSRDAYLDFFCQPPLSFPNHNYHPLNEKDYYKLSLLLPKDSKIFWNTLFNNYNGKFLKKHFFMKDELSKKHLIKNNPYLSHDNYQSLPSKLEKSNLLFIQDNVINIPNIPNNYDVIYLSNVLDYLFTYYFTKLDNQEYQMHPSVAKNYLNFISQNIDKLTPNGLLFFHYMWDIRNYGYQYYSGFDKLLLPRENINKLIIPGSNHFNDEQDSIYVYTKKLK